VCHSAEKEECGTTFESSRVVGGQTTKPGTFPSAALLGRMELVEQKHVYDHTRTELVSVLKFRCGGTLINRCGQEYMYNVHLHFLYPRYMVNYSMCHGN
jgi:hypothetical protein